MLKLIGTFLVAAAITASFSTQQRLPPVAKEIQSLAPFLGVWKGEIAAGPNGELKGPATMTFDKILDGVYVQMNLTHELPGPIIVRGQTTFSWNPKSAKYQSFTFGNGGMEDPTRPREEMGALTGKTLKMEGKMQGFAYYQSYTIQADNSLKYEFGMNTDGKWTIVGSAVLKKAS